MNWKRLSILLGTLLLLTPAFKNNYPFLYPDTTTYLHAGFNYILSPLRPMLYGVFIRHCSLLESFWLVVFVQSWIVSYLIHLFFQTFSLKDKDLRPLLSIFFLTLFTSISISVGMLMPDFLTLSCVILVFGKNVHWGVQLFCSTILYFALLSHHSHFYILLISSIFLTLFLLCQKKMDSKKILVYKSIFVLLLTISSFWGMQALHYQLAGVAMRENASHVFMLNRINRMGLLSKFLSEKCPSKNYDICKHCCEIPYDFLWDGNSPLNKEPNSWESHKEDYNRVMKDFLSDPIYVRKFIIGTMENTISQFFCFEGQLIFPETEAGEWGAFRGIKEIWPEQINQLKSSLQYKNRWEFRDSDIYIRFAVFSSLMFLIYIYILF